MTSLATRPAHCPARRAHDRCDRDMRSVYGPHVPIPAIFGLSAQSWERPEQLGPTARRPAGHLAALDDRADTTAVSARSSALRCTHLDAARYGRSCSGPSQPSSPRDGAGGQARAVACWGCVRWEPGTVRRVTPRRFQALMAAIAVTMAASAGSS